MRVRAVLSGLFLLAMPVPVFADPIALRDRLDILLQVYSSHIAATDRNRLVMTDGTELLIDDGQEKTHRQKLANPDIEDMLSQIYPVGSCFRGESARNFDPGRIRVNGFFKAVYGATPRHVQSRIVTIDWFGSRVSVTGVGGADQALRQVADDLDKLGAGMRKYVEKTAGTFNWRKISGTDRLSVHS
ncbi:MAG: hypothetical protein K8F25_07390, partial [Fimbriimonadaceae bacterium]|nr:hypothetical protein [Alphaproteobacteria bacterium]